MRTLTYVIFFSCFSCLASLFSVAMAADMPMSLFEYQNSKSIIDSNIKYLVINQELKSAQVGQKLELKLPTGARISVTISDRQTKANQTTVVRAVGKDDVQMLITIGEKASFGSIDSPDISYSLGFDPAGGQFLSNNLERAASFIDLENDMMFPPSAKQGFKKTLPEPLLNSSAPADMTLMIVYSPEFGLGMGDPDTAIQQLVEFTNQSLSNTGVDGQFRLVAAVELDFDNELSNSTLLNQVTEGSGAFSSVPSLRNQVGADMVSVLSFSDTNSASGLAWVNGDNPDFAYSVRRLSPVCCSLVFAHELGHNLGSGHERDSVNPAAGSCDDGASRGGFNGFSCGYGVAGNFGTIMSRIQSNATSFNRFSNPNQICNGLPCGIAQGQANAADNFTSFNISAFLIEQFRPNVNPPTPEPNPRAPTSRNLTAIIAPLVPLLLNDDVY